MDAQKEEWLAGHGAARGRGGGCEGQFLPLTSRWAVSRLVVSFGDSLTLGGGSPSKESGRHLTDTENTGGAQK